MIQALRQPNIVALDYRQFFILTTLIVEEQRIQHHIIVKIHLQTLDCLMH